MPVVGCNVSVVSDRLNDAAHGSNRGLAGLQLIGGAENVSLRTEQGLTASEMVASGNIFDNFIASTINQPSGMQRQPGYSGNVSTSQTEYDYCGQPFVSQYGRSSVSNPNGSPDNAFLLPYQDHNYGGQGKGFPSSNSTVYAGMSGTSARSRARTNSNSSVSSSGNNGSSPTQFPPIPPLEIYFAQQQQLANNASASAVGGTVSSSMQQTVAGLPPMDTPKSVQHIQVHRLAFSPRHEDSYCDEPDVMGNGVGPNSSTTAQAIVDEVVASVIGPKRQVQQQPPSQPVSPLLQGFYSLISAAQHVDELALTAAAHHKESEPNDFRKPGESPKKKSQLPPSATKSRSASRRKRQTSTASATNASAESRKSYSKPRKTPSHHAEGSSFASEIERLYRNRIEELGGPLLYPRLSDEESESSSGTSPTLTESKRKFPQKKLLKPRKSVKSESDHTPQQQQQQQLSAARKRKSSESTTESATMKQRGDIRRSRKVKREQNEWTGQDYVTRCICGYSHNDDFMIQCEKCDVWQHGDCMGVRRRNVPEHYLCEWCSLRPVDNDKARKIQKKKRRELEISSESESEGSKQVVQRPFDGSRPELFRHLQEKYAEAFKNEFSHAILQTVRTLSDTDGGLPSRDSLKQKMCEVMDVALQRPGLVAARTIPAEQAVVEYRGNISLITEYDGKDELGRYHPCVLLYRMREGKKDILNISVDARTQGNVARFIRRSCTPNTEIRHVIDGPLLHIVVVATKLIDKGVEITIPFDFDYHSCDYFVECACRRQADCPVQKHNLELKAQRPAAHVNIEQPTKVKSVQSQDSVSKTVSRRKRQATETNVNSSGESAVKNEPDDFADQKGKKWKVKLSAAASRAAAMTSTSKAAAEKKKKAIATAHAGAGRIKSRENKDRQATVPAPPAPVSKRKSPKSESLSNDETRLEKMPAPKKKDTKSPAVSSSDESPLHNVSKMSRDDRKLQSLWKVIERGVGSKGGTKKASLEADRVREREKERKEIFAEVEFIKLTAASVATQQEKPSVLTPPPPQTSTQLLALDCNSKEILTKSVSSLKPDPVLAPTQPEQPMSPKRPGFSEKVAVAKTPHRKNELKGLQDYWVKKEKEGIATESWTLPGDRTKDREQRKLEELAARLERLEESKKGKRKSESSESDHVKKEPIPEEQESIPEQPKQQPTKKETSKKPVVTKKATPIVKTETDAAPVKRKPGRPPGSGKKQQQEESLEKEEKSVVQKKSSTSSKNPSKPPTAKNKKKNDVKKPLDKRRLRFTSSSCPKNGAVQQSSDSDSDLGSAGKIHSKFASSPVGSPVEVKASAAKSEHSSTQQQQQIDVRTAAQKKHFDSPNVHADDNHQSSMVSFEAASRSPVVGQRTFGSRLGSSDSDSTGVPARKRWLRQVMSQNTQSSTDGNAMTTELMDPVPSDYLSSKTISSFASQNAFSLQQQQQCYSFVSILNKDDILPNYYSQDDGHSLSQLGYTTSLSQLGYTTALPEIQPGLSLNKPVETEVHPPELIPEAQQPEPVKKKVSLKEYRQRKKEIPAVGELPTASTTMAASEVSNFQGAENTSQPGAARPAGVPKFGFSGATATLTKPIIARQPLHHSSSKEYDSDLRNNLTARAVRLSADSHAVSRPIAGAPTPSSLADLKQKIYGFDIGKALGVSQTAASGSSNSTSSTTLAVAADDFFQEAERMLVSKKPEQTAANVSHTVSSSKGEVRQQSTRKQEPVRMSLSERLRMEFGVEADPEITEVGPGPTSDEQASSTRLMTSGNVPFYPAPAVSSQPPLASNVPYSVAVSQTPQVIGQMFQVFSNMMGTMMSTIQQNSGQPVPQLLSQPPPPIVPGVLPSTVEAGNSSTSRPGSSFGTNQPQQPDWDRLVQAYSNSGGGPGL